LCRLLTQFARFARYIELTKRVFKATNTAKVERDVTMRVLWTCMDNAMRLFHPFMPFVSEELWQRLPGLMILLLAILLLCWAFDLPE
jgi:valyl-tRNA synthetase